MRQNLKIIFKNVTCFRFATAQILFVNPSPDVDLVPAPPLNITVSSSSFSAGDIA